MKLLFVMDGTVITTVAKIFATDGPSFGLENVSIYEFDVAEDIGGIPTTWVVVDVNENGGIDGVTPATSELDAQDTVANLVDEDDVGVSVDRYHYVDPRHFVVTYHEGEDDASYVHAFAL